MPTISLMKGSASWKPRRLEKNNYQLLVIALFYEHHVMNSVVGTETIFQGRPDCRNCKALPSLSTLTYFAHNTHVMKQSSPRTTHCIAALDRHTK